ncbi:nucleotide sugar dehydrogenase [Vineibacter terrae]|uniref:Nucleotide sugar dehydrogenase n=1 Tax=Vineibacter terrae TaxID=2586908 RepID=A0A5C8PQM5_9HYPH|nr:nucleotide sugar dehydrogenase [Vineibacter terrae]TXL77080.1 nucleotide sugar dehydrogenase [Vineibacter terrae]
MGHNRRISVIGLGYVGLPVAAAFARIGSPTIGFDISSARVQELRAGHDRTHEVDAVDLQRPGLLFTADAADLRNADFHIVTVPTPTDSSNRPDLTPLHAASEAVGRQLKKGDIVVYESTVYPGVTETECVPILERESGLTWKTDFNVAYSPERINPGDRERRFETIRKVISADTPATLDIVDDVYGSVVTAGTYRAASIKVAEAAKAVENTQRDLNIALINELALIFDRLEIDTRDVLEAAGTKWNFLPFRPGLVGGHCIGVDPFYLTHVAESVGYNSQVILAGRRVNDGMGLYVANRIVRNLMRRGWNGRPVVTILGFTFKENVPDVRNTRVADVVRELRNFGVLAQVHDPQADPAEVRRQYGLELKDLDAMAPADAVVLAVAHKQYIDAGWSLVRRLLKNDSGYVADVQGVLDRDIRPADIALWRL